ncbi:hypothetical protein N7450_011746 [Penicillium hetheringtonii]|uniref:Uncharacterized protein n=1 Tax=Penicillium hetheringtonii TaxID=911720 RepID=A0AAD6DAM2_9EURO|nr:hypothetical protein N7450_011746 [Penicillium hetheringtonii]
MYKPRTGVSGNPSRRSVQSTISESDTDSASLSPTASRISVGLITSSPNNTMKSSVERSKKRRLESSHRKCFDIIDRCAEKYQKVVAEQEADKASIAQLVQELRDENAREASNALKANSEKETAVAEAERLTKEISQLQQQLESTNTTMQDQVAWDDIQPVLHQTHGELISAATHFGNFIDTLQNKRLASFLPSTEVLNGNWPAHGGPVGATDPAALPGLSGLSNPPLFDPHVSGSVNHQESYA